MSAQDTAYRVNISLYIKELWFLIVMFILHQCLIELYV